MCEAYKDTMCFSPERDAFASMFDVHPIEPGPRIYCHLETDHAGPHVGLIWDSRGRAGEDEGKLYCWPKAP